MTSQHAILPGSQPFCGGKSGFHPEGGGGGGGGRGGSFPPKIWDNCIEKYIKPHPFPGASPPK